MQGAPRVRVVVGVGMNAVEVVESSGFARGARTRLDAPWSFAELLQPLDLSQFFAEFWGRRPVRLARNQPEFYAQLLQLQDLERYLSLEEIFERQSITTPRRGYGPPDPPPASLAEVHQRLRSGCSLRVRRMECFLDPNEPVMHLLRSMQAALQHPKESLSCYVTPPGAEGLGAHHDETEIFTLQISGKKRWRLYHRAEGAASAVHDASTLGAARADFVLEPGDLLYVPRNVIHEVTTDVAAFSLTIVFRPFDWSALLHLIVSRLAGTQAFLTPLPAGALFAPDAAERLQPAFAERIELLRGALSELGPEALLDACAGKFVSGLAPAPAAHIERLLAAQPLSLDTWLERTRNIACHLSPQPDRATLRVAGGGVLDANARATPALREALNATAPFRVADMHRSLSPAARLALAERLVDAGVLRVVAPARDPQVEETSHE